MEGNGVALPAEQAADLRADLALTVNHCSRCHERSGLESPAADTLARFRGAGDMGDEGGEFDDGFDDEFETVRRVRESESRGDVVVAVVGAEDRRPHVRVHLAVDDPDRVAAAHPGHAGVADEEAPSSVAAISRRSVRRDTRVAGTAPCGVAAGIA